MSTKKERNIPILREKFKKNPHNYCIIPIVLDSRFHKDMIFRVALRRFPLSREFCLLGEDRTNKSKISNTIGIKTVKFKLDWRNEKLSS